MGKYLHMIWIFLIKHKERRGQLQGRGCPDFSIAPSIPFCFMKSTIGRTPFPLSISKLLTCIFLCKFSCDVFTIIKLKIISIFCLYFALDHTAALLSSSPVFWLFCFLHSWRLKSEKRGISLLHYAISIYRYWKGYTYLRWVNMKGKRALKSKCWFKFAYLCQIVIRRYLAGHNLDPVSLWKSLNYTLNLFDGCDSGHTM